MGRIFYLMGKSSSGKDTVYRELLKDQELALSPVLLYTTRPMRAGEKDGQDYHFIGEEKLRRLQSQGCVIEVREYSTVHGIWKYATVDDGTVTAGSADFLAIGTVASYRAVCEWYGREKVIPIYLAVEDGLRLSRALQREKQQENPCYAEVCRRFLADEEDFSAEKLAEAGIVRTFRNDDLKRCLREIKVYLFSFL